MKGFSAIEVIIVVSIIALAASIFIFSGTAFRQNQLLAGGVETVLGVLNDARTRTLSSIGNSQHGVCFESNGMVLFQGVSCPGSNQEIISLEPGLVISTALAGGATSVVFQRLTGKTAENGTITISLAAAPNQSRVIRLESTGLARPE